MSANFRDIPANFRDICVLFFVSTRNMLQTCFQLLWEFSSGISPNFLGLPFSYLQPRLPFSYYVMERAAKACEEPENTWNDQKLRYFKFSSLSHPGSSKSRFCWISLFFLALRAPQVLADSFLKWFLINFHWFLIHVGWLQDRFCCSTWLWSMASVRSGLAILQLCSENSGTTIEESLASFCMASE